MCCSTPLREASRSITRSASAASGFPADSFSTRGRTATFRSKASSRPITPSSTPGCSPWRSSSSAFVLRARSLGYDLVRRRPARLSFGAAGHSDLRRSAESAICSGIACFGIEEGVDALLSPTHQILGLRHLLLVERADSLGSCRPPPLDDARAPTAARARACDVADPGAFRHGLRVRSGRRAHQRSAADRAVQRRTTSPRSRSDTIRLRAAF